MSKLVKYSLVGLGLIIVIISLLMVMAFVFIDPNSYRQQLVEMVKKQTGRDLEISGQVSLSLFPWLGVQFGEMKLNGPAGFKPADFLSLQEAKIKVAVMPLLWGRVDIDHILVDGLSLKLLKTKQGDANWDFPSVQSTPASQAQQIETAKKKESGEAGSSGLAAVRLGSLTFKNSAIHYQDHQSGSNIMANNFGLSLDRLASGEQAEFSLVTDISLKEKHAMPIAIKSKLMIDWQQKIAQLISSKIELGEIILQTQLTARFHDDLVIQGSTRLNKIAPLPALKTIGVIYKPENKNVMQSMQASLGFTYKTGKTNSMELKNIKIMLDRAEVAGDVTVALDDKNPHTFDLVMKNLNTDHYLPAQAVVKKEKGAKSGKSVNKKKTDDAINLPVDMLRSLNTHGQLNIENIRASGIGFNSVKTSLVAKNGLISLKPFQAELYEGKGTGSFLLDVRKNNPRYEASQDLRNIQMGGLIKDMGIYDDFSGKGNLKLNVTTAGSKVSTLKSNLKGSFSTKLGKGKLVGADFIRQIREARELYEQLQGKQKKSSKPSTGNETVYDQLTASAIITKGVINNQDLHLIGPKLQITGKGQIDLPKNWISYRLKARYQEKQGKDPIKAPIKVKGTLDDPKIKVEYQKVLRKETNKRLRKEVEKQLGNELRKGLEGLFSR